MFMRSTLCALVLGLTNLVCAQQTHEEKLAAAIEHFIKPEEDTSILGQFQEQSLGTLVDLSDLPDPLTVKTAEARQTYANDLLRRYKETARKHFSPSLAHIINETQIVYDADGSRITAAQRDVIKDEEQDGTYNPLQEMQMGLFKGRAIDFCEEYKKRKKHNASMKKFKAGARAMVARRTSSIKGKGKSPAIHVFPAWFVLFPYKGGDKAHTAEERKRLTLANLEHELVHVLRARTGMYVNGKQLTVDNAEELLDLPRTHVRGVMRLVEEKIASAHERRSLQGFPALQRANSHYEQTGNQLTPYTNAFPKLRKFLRRY